MPPRAMPDGVPRSEPPGADPAAARARGGIVPLPDHPFSSRVPAAPAAPRPLDGVLVADFSSLWAGPLCAHLLGLAGAHVVKVETPARPDGARRGNADSYNLLHAGRRSVVLDPSASTGRGAMAALVHAADIVRPR